MLNDLITVDKPFLIMAHRGFWGGNIIENTRQSAMLAKRAGAEIIEIDICRSKDGVYYLYHDGNELGLLGLNLNFHHWLSKDIDEISVLNTLGTRSGYQIEKLEAFLEWLPEDYFINIDRSWDYWEDAHFFDILKASNKIEQFIIKSPVRPHLLEQLNQQQIRIPFAPIIYRQEEMEMLSQFDNINVKAVEIIIDKIENHELLREDFIRMLKERSLLIIANAEDLGEDYHLFENYNDTTALLEDEISWGTMIASGVDIIQTDWPNFLNDYRRNYGRQ